MVRRRAIPPAPAADMAADGRHHRNLRARIAAAEAGDAELSLRLRQEAVAHDDVDCPRTAAWRSTRPAA